MSYMDMLTSLFLIILSINIVGVRAAESSESEEIDWQCGTDDFTKYISENQIDIDCPALKKTINQCCLTHDDCYVDQKGRKYCDDTFCQCLLDSTASSVLCHKEDGPLFCGLVREFGADAYRRSGNGTSLDEAEDLLTNSTMKLDAHSAGANSTDYDYESAVSKPHHW